jgi:hypothetical protein
MAVPLDLHHPDQHHSDQHHPRLSKALLLMLRHPIRGVLFHWNWKAALLSAAIRSAIFFGVNLRAGRISAVKAMLVEAVYAAWASGLFGAITQNLRNARPAWITGLIISVLLPVAFQVFQYIVHWYMGTPLLAASMIVSIAFAGLSSLFNWYAMRRGTLLTGREGHSLFADIKSLPLIALNFTTAIPRALAGLVARRTERAR